MIYDARNGYFSFKFFKSKLNRHKQKFDVNDSIELKKIKSRIFLKKVVRSLSMEIFSLNRMIFLESIFEMNENLESSDDEKNFSRNVYFFRGA